MSEHQQTSSQNSETDFLANRIIKKNRHYFVVCSSEVPAKWESICSIVADL